LYRRRSPTTFARTIAFSGVPLQIWWNPHEDVVVHQGTTQSGAFVRLLRRLNPKAPVEPVVHDRPHGDVFRSTTSLPDIVDFLLGRKGAAAPAAGFSYRSWLPNVRHWGWSFRSGDVGRGFWQIDGASAHGFRVVSPARLEVTPPGMRTMRFAPGRHVVALR